MDKYNVKDSISCTEYYSILANCFGYVSPLSNVFGGFGGSQKEKTECWTYAIYT